MPATPSRRSGLRVLLFSGSRGSEVITSQLVTHPSVELTVAINTLMDGRPEGPAS